jgi:hypothetical protein
MKKLYKALPALFALSLGAVLMHNSPAQAKDCDWKVSGKISSLNLLSELKTKFGSKSYLENLEVKVSAKEKVLGIWGTWNAWNMVRSNSSGSFTASNNKNCDERRFKVEVRFNDDDLEIHWEKSTQILNKDVKWYTVHDETSGEHSASVVNLGEFTFGTNKLDLNDYDAHHHADIWQAYHMAIDHFKGMSPELSFKNKIKVKYPHDSAIVGSNEASYANPITKHIYIHKDSDSDHFDLGTMYHELFHIWVYDHFSGEGCLTESLVITGNTHGIVNDPCVAFNEGAAEWGSEQLEQALFDITPELPRSRQALKSAGATNLGLVQRFDDGWQSLLSIITLPDLNKYNFNGSSTYIGLLSPAPSNCSTPSNGFRKVLRVFLENPDVGYPKLLSKAETTIESFLTRADAILTNFGTASVSDLLMRNLYRDLADTSKTTQPSSVLCGG